MERQSSMASSIANRKSQIVNEWAFTLIELLTVIAIIAILAALLLPVLAAAKIRTQKTQARLQISDLVTAIQNYDSAYSRLPIPAAVQQSVSSNNFTFGGVYQTPSGLWPPTPPPNYITSNSDVIAILMDLTNYPAGGMVLANVNYQKNPQQTIFLNAKMVGYANLPGVGPDLVYRDPWKNPYVITLDLNDDNQCLDPFYNLQSVSQTRPTLSAPPGNYNTPTGYNGLVNNADANGNGDHFAYHGNVMVWSAGPDGKVDLKAPANQGANKDNIISWQ